jgi:hypothetical protein
MNYITTKTIYTTYYEIEPGTEIVHLGDNFFSTYLIAKELPISLGSILSIGSMRNRFQMDVDISVMIEHGYLKESTEKERNKWKKLKLLK